MPKIRLPYQTSPTKFKQLFCLLFFIGFLSSCSNRLISDPNPSLERLAKGGSWESEIEQLVQPLIDSKDNIGAIVAILDKDQQTSYYSFGVGDLEKQNKISKETLFGIGSTTKSMVVSLMLALDEQGVISVDDTIEELLPANFALTDLRIKNITFAQLASHTSGLPREPVNLDTLMSLLYYFFTGDNLYKHLTEEAVFEFLKEFELPENLSTAPTYSNIGIGLLAHFLTIKTEQDLESLLQQYVFNPLDMQNTQISLNEKNKALLATGYSGDQPLFVPWNKPLDNWKFSSVMLGTGGVYSTAEDLIKYLKAHLGQSNTQLDIILKQSRKILGKDRDHFLTMGWYVDYLAEYDTYLYFYHGMISGFNCYIGFEPETQTAVVVLRNNFNWVDPIGHNLLLKLSQFYKQQQ